MMTSEEVCCLYRPTRTSSPSPERERSVHQNNEDELPSLPFIPLLRGAEPLSSVKERYESFQRLWQPRQKAIDDIFHQTNSKTIDIVTHFVLQNGDIESPTIPTGLLVQHADSSVSTSLPDLLADTLNNEDNTVCISLVSGPNSSLKSILRSINDTFKTHFSRVGNETVHDEHSKAIRYLTYDLHILFDEVRARMVKTVVLLFRDGEAFDGALLNDLLQLLSSWMDRIPFVLIFCLATSVELFQAKLSRSAIRSLHCQLFQAENVNVEDIFRTVVSPGDVYMSSALCEMILERQRNNIENPYGLARAWKYALMAHFFSNPLSVWVEHLPPENGVEQMLALRHTESFKNWIEGQIRTGKYSTVRQYLTGNLLSPKSVVEEVKTTKQALSDILSAVDLIHLIHNALHGKQRGEAPLLWSDLYVLAMSGRLSRSEMLRDTVSSMQKCHAPVMVDILSQVIVPNDNEALASALTDLKALMSSFADITTLKSTYSSTASSLRTTVVAQKVELSKQPAGSSPSEVEYTKIVDRIIIAISQMLEKSLVDPRDLFLHEAFVYDGKLQYREAFMPRPRAAAERALSCPNDYLGSECSGAVDQGLSASMPAISIVYQLYLEAGSVLNTADLWDAFWTIVQPEDGDEQEMDQEKALALFSRALAEMKYLGMVKNSRKKADHLAKLMWRGL